MVPSACFAEEIPVRVMGWLRQAQPPLTLLDFPNPSTENIKTQLFRIELIDYSSGVAKLTRASRALLMELQENG